MTMMMMTAVLCSTQFTPCPEKKDPEH